MLNTHIENHTPELFQKLEASVSRFVINTAREMGERARTLMKGPKSGRVYRHHRASAPGEAPANFSGRYLGSIEVVQMNTLEAKVGARVPYASILENGMDRPMWGPILKEILPNLDRRLAEEIAAAGL